MADETITTIIFIGLMLVLFSINPIIYGLILLFIINKK